MFSRGWRRTCLVILLAAALMVPVEGTAKFRDAVQFEDNRFVGIGNFELLHRFQRISGDTMTLDRTQLRYQLVYGVMRNFEVGVRVPVILYENGDEGVGDISLLQRFKFTDEGYNFPETSGGFELFFPTGDENDVPPTGSGSLNVRLFAAMGDDLAPGWAWLAHGGVTFFGDSDVEDAYEYNGALRYRTYPSMKVNFELNGSTGGLVDRSELYVSPGLLLHARNGLSVSLSFPVGVTSESADQKATLQVSHEF